MSTNLDKSKPMDLSTAAVSALASVGLDSNAIQVYAALCELGRASVAAIAKKSGLKRTSVYSILDRLEGLGLVSREQRAKKLDYIPTGPDSLVRMAEEKKYEAEKALILAKDLAAILKSREGRDSLIRAKVQIFEGRAAILSMLRNQDSVWRQSLMLGDKTWWGFHDDSFFESYGEWLLGYWRKFSSAPDAKDEKICMFSNQSDVHRRVSERVRNHVLGSRTIRMLPKQIKLASGIWIGGEFVCMVKTTKSPHTAILFRDRDLAQNLAAIFRYLWELSESEGRAKDV